MNKKVIKRINDGYIVSRNGNIVDMRLILGNENDRYKHADHAITSGYGMTERVLKDHLREDTMYETRYQNGYLVIYPYAKRDMLVNKTIENRVDELIGYIEKTNGEEIVKRGKYETIKDKFDYFMKKIDGKPQYLIPAGVFTAYLIDKVINIGVILNYLGSFAR